MLLNNLLLLSLSLSLIFFLIQDPSLGGREMYSRILEIRARQGSLKANPVRWQINMVYQDMKHGKKKSN